MIILDWLFIICSSTFLITFLISIFSCFQLFMTKKEFDELKQKRPKNTQKKKRWLKKRRLLNKKKSMQFKRSVILFVVSGILLGSGLYARYYQLTNLSSTDGTIIVQSYFLTDEMKKQLNNLQNGEDTEKTKEKLMELSSLLASYGSSTPSNSLSQEGQKLLNRYYVQLRDYGTNMYSLTVEQLNNQETVSSYIENLKQIKQTQKKVFTQFGVDESALKQKK